MPRDPQIEDRTYTPDSELRHPLRLLRGMGSDLVAGRELAWQLFVRSGDGIADLIHMRNVARVRVTGEGIDAIPLRGPMALNHLRQGSPVYVPRTWMFYKESELTHTVESRCS